MNEYRFSAALEKYQKAAAADTLENLNLDSKILNAKNAISLLDIASSPNVVAKQKFSLDNFFLFYPLKDKSWRPIPNPLDSAKTEGSLVKAMYFPEGVDRMYWSAEDEDKSRNIYFSERRDTIWSLPTIMDENIISASSEIYPMLSDDGQHLWFASNGMYGVGGYDLYVSNWDEATGSWGTPVNMGFPYSSPADDFLYMNTPDGKYSIFASNRECSRDSVYLYVLERENMPVRTQMTEREVKLLAQLEPVEDASKMDNNAAAHTDASDNDDNSEIREYVGKMEHIMALRDTLSIYESQIDQRRNIYAESDDLDERTALTEEIMAMEQQLPYLQDSLKNAIAEVQKIEMDFLFRGVIIDPSVIADEADKEVVGAKTNYTFVRQTMGAPLDIKVEQPVKEFDYSFQILPEAQMAENQEIPDGIVYQIQFLTSSREASLAKLKGLSPVFVHHPSSNKWIYRVGVFRNYSDVVANMNKVKRLGFRSAFTVAFKDGKSITVASAKKLEAKIEKKLWQVTLTPDGEMGTPEARNIINSLTDNKITIANSSGKIIFVVTGFPSETEAEKFIRLAVSGGFESGKVTELPSSDK